MFFENKEGFCNKKANIVGVDLKGRYIRNEQK
jgi:hypothetical protein